MALTSAIVSYEESLHLIAMSRRDLTAMRYSIIHDWLCIRTYRRSLAECRACLRAQDEVGRATTATEGRAAGDRDPH